MLHSRLLKLTKSKAHSTPGRNRWTFPDVRIGRFARTTPANSSGMVRKRLRRRCISLYRILRSVRCVPPVKSCTLWANARIGKCVPGTPAPNERGGRRHPCCVSERHDLLDPSVLDICLVPWRQRVPAPHRHHEFHRGPGTGAGRSGVRGRVNTRSTLVEPQISRIVLPAKKGEK